MPTPAAQPMVVKSAPAPAPQPVVPALTEERVREIAKSTAPKVSSGLTEKQILRIVEQAVANELHYAGFSREGFKNLQGDVHRLSGRVKGVETGLNNVGENVGRLDSRMIRVENELQNLTARVEGPIEVKRAEKLAGLKKDIFVPVELDPATGRVRLSDVQYVQDRITEGFTPVVVLGSTPRYTGTDVETSKATHNLVGYQNAMVAANGVGLAVYEAADDEKLKLLRGWGMNFAAVYMTAPSPKPIK